MRKKKHILIFTLLIILLSLAYFLVNTSAPQGEAKKENNIVSGVKVEAQEKWVTHVSENFKISFDLPEQWKVTEHSGSSIQLETGISADDDADISYSVFVAKRDNPEGKSFEDLIFPEETYEGLYTVGISELYTKEGTKDLTVYKTHRLLSQSGTLHYFLTKDGISFVEFSLFPYNPDSFQLNQDKMMDYLDRITNSIKID